MENSMQKQSPPQSPPQQPPPPTRAGFFKTIFHDFQQFMFTNNVIIVATGWGIGTATKDIIERLVKDLFIPILHFLGKFSMIKYGYAKLLAYVESTKLEGVLTALSNITWDFMIWIFVIVMTFVMLEYVLNRSIIGLRTTIPEQSKSAFAKSKEAAKESIIPDEKGRELIQKQIIMEEKTGKNLIQRDEHVLKGILKPTTMPPRS